MMIPAFFLLGVSAFAAAPLHVYFIDVEGGQSTLIVAPTGQAMLIDAGWNERDALRIQQTMRDAGVKSLDYLAVTHYHRDHAGGVPALAKLVLIRTYLDHGANTDHSAAGEAVMAAYENAAGSKRRAVHPGDQFALGGVKILVLAANGQNFRPMVGLPNPFCGTEKPRPDEKTENAQSLG